MSCINSKISGISQLCDRLEKIYVISQGLLTFEQQKDIPHHRRTLNFVYERHGSGHSLDALKIDFRHLRFSNLNQLFGSENLVNTSSNKRLSSKSFDYKVEVERTHASHGISCEYLSRNTNIFTVSRAQS